MQKSWSLPEMLECLESLVWPLPALSVGWDCNRLLVNELCSEKLGYQGLLSSWPPLVNITVLYTFGHVVNDLALIRWNPYSFGVKVCVYIYMCGCVCVKICAFVSLTLLSVCLCVCYIHNWMCTLLFTDRRIRKGNSSSWKTRTRRKKIKRKPLRR